MYPTVCENERSRLHMPPFPSCQKIICNYVKTRLSSFTPLKILLNAAICYTLSLKRATFEKVL